MRRITTVEHLGPDATESDLTEFLRCGELVQGLVPGRTEDEAIDLVWNNGRWTDIVERLNNTVLWA